MSTSNVSLIKLPLALVFSIVIAGCQTISSKPVDDTSQIGSDGRLKYKIIDVSSNPDGVLSQSRLEAFWRTADRGKECQAGLDYARGKALPVTTYSAEALAAAEWRSPYVVELGDFPSPFVTKKFPPPITEVSLNEAYGARVYEVDQAREWFLATAVNALHPTRRSEYRLGLRQALVEWAQADALSKGIRVSWGKRPVDWQVLTLIGALINSTALLADDLTPQEKAIVGPWVNRLAREIGNSYWASRQDNKAYMRSYYLALWAVTIGDFNLLAELAEQYKLAINDMRPDGSMPIDSSRSGMGLKYHSDSARYLTSLAYLFETQAKLPLKRYTTADGRDLDTLVNFAIQGMKEPIETNRLHARPCPNGGDRWGGIETPSTSYISRMDFLKFYYLPMNPDTPHAKWLEMRGSSPKADEVLGPVAQGLFRKLASD